MFLFAQLSIQLLGMLLTVAWIENFSDAFGHLLKVSGICPAIYVLVVGLPLLFLWRAYKESFVKFVSPQDLVEASGRNPERRLWPAYGVVLIALGLLVAVGLYLIRAK